MVTGSKCVEMFITRLWGTDGYQENGQFQLFHTINFCQRDVSILVAGGEHQGIASHEKVPLGVYRCRGGEGQREVRKVSIAL